MGNKSYIIIPLLFSAVIMFFTLVLPKYEDLGVQRLNVVGKEQELQSKKDYFDKIRKQHKDLIEQKELFDKVESALPDDPSLPSVFNYFSSMAQSNGLGLAEIEFGDKAHQTAPADGRIKTKEFDIEMSLEGKYHPHFRRFLSVIENSSKLFRIEEISFSSPKDPEEPFSFKINLKTYGH